jgi:hypothetical protein
VQLSASDLPAAAGRPFGEGLLQLFYCTSSRPHCEVDAQAFFPFSRAVIVRVVPPSNVDPSHAISPGEAAAFPCRAIVGWREEIDYPNREEQEALGALLESAAIDGLARTFPRSGDKLLGWPLWGQGIEYPKCPDCGDVMEYVFQIDSQDNIPYRFGDGGCGHVSRCARHPERLAFGWASG